MKFKITIALLLLLFSKEVRGQLALSYSYNDYLPITNVTGTYQDEEGYLWVILSRAGILRFDGATSKLYSTTEVNPNYRLPWDELHPTNMYELDGVLWMLFTNSSIGAIQNKKVIHSVTLKESKGKAYFILQGRKPLTIVQKNTQNFGELIFWEKSSAIAAERDSLVECWGDSLYFRPIYDTTYWGLDASTVSAIDNDEVLVHCMDEKSRIFKGAEYINLNTQKAIRLKDLDVFVDKQEVYIFPSLSDGTLFIELRHGYILKKIFKYSKEGLKEVNWRLSKAKEYKTEYYPYSRVVEGVLSIVYSSDQEKGGSHLLAFNKKNFSHIPFLSKIRLGNSTNAKFNHKSFWRCSEDGLYKIDSWIKGFQGSLYTNMPFNVWSIQEDRYHKIWFGAYDNHNSLAYWKYGNWEIDKAPEELSTKLYYHGPIMGSDSMMLIPARNGILYFDGKDQYKYILKDRLSLFMYKSPYDNRLALCSVGKGIYLYKNGDIELAENWKNIPDDSLKMNNVLTVVHDKYGRWWGGRSRSGVFCYVEDTLDSHKDIAYTFTIATKNDGIGMMSTTQDSFHNLWFGTNRGLYLYDINTKGKRIPDTSDFEPFLFEYFGETTVSTLLNYKDSLLFIGDDQGGLGVLNLQAFYKNKDTLFTFFDLRKKYEIKEIFQNCFFEDSKGGVWLSSSELVLRLQASEIPFLKDSICLGWDSLSVNNIAVWEGGQEDTCFVSLASSERELLFHGNYLSRLLESYDGFFFTLKEGNKIIIESREVYPQWKYNFVSPGTYTLEMEVRERNHVVNKRVLILEVQSIFYERISFWVTLVTLGGLLIIFTITGVAYFRLQAQKQQQKIVEKELLVTELKSENTEFFVQALANSTHGHFINNTLHHVQALIYDQKALVMIRKLSNLIGAFFEKSRARKLYHSLDDELDLIDNLVYIQQQRLSNRFAIYIPIDKALKKKHKDFNIPIGSLFTHVENAIKHGLEKRDTGYEGMLHIILEENLPSIDYITFLIKDNGVGIGDGILLSDKNQGLLNQKKIIDRYNELNEQKICFEINNIGYDKLGQSLGTIVSVQIPKIYNYELV